MNSFQLPSNKNATQSPLAPDLSTIKLIDYDFAKYGSSDERKRLLAKWDDGGGVAAAVGVWPRAPPAALHPTVVLWTAVGLVGFCLLPWYAVDDGFFTLRWLFDGWPLDEDVAPALFLVAPGREALAGADRPHPARCRSSPGAATSPTRSSAACSSSSAPLGLVWLLAAGLRHRPARLALRLARPRSSASSTAASSAWATARSLTGPRLPLPADPRHRRARRGRRRRLRRRLDRLRHRDGRRSSSSCRSCRCSPTPSSPRTAATRSPPSASSSSATGSGRSAA